MSFVNQKETVRVPLMQALQISKNATYPKKEGKNSKTEYCLATE